MDAPVTTAVDSGSRHKLIALIFGLSALIIFGLIWAFFLGPSKPEGLGWYLFSYSMGLTMIVLPCTFPLAFVIVPLSMGKGPMKGLGIALSFGLGVTITLSMYGVLAAVLGKVFIGILGTSGEVLKNWLYFVAGAIAYIFALGELGLVNFKMPSYSGAAPAIIQKQKDYLKAFLLGLFLGNIGVGCPHPATPLIFLEIARSGNIFYGWTLFLVHVIGRVLPLILLVVMGLVGVNGLSWLVARREKIERGTGWLMIFVAAFILVLGLFTHGWWVNSGQHTLLETFTQEEKLLNIVGSKLGTGNAHHHGTEAGAGLFGLPLGIGDWVLVLLWILPLWWNYSKVKKTDPARYRFDFYLTLTVLLAITFIWFLPERFRAQNGIAPGGGMMMADGTMAHVRGPYMNHEAADIKDGLTVDMNLSPLPVNMGTKEKMDFFINQKPGNVAVPISQLQVERTKLMHVIGVRSDMNEFFHVHPEAGPNDPHGVMSVAYTFAKPGKYKIWSQIMKDGVVHNFGQPPITVDGFGNTEDKNVAFDRTSIVGNYQIGLQYSDIPSQNNNFQFSFDIHSLTGGQEVALEDFLGVPMHLAIIKDDWSEFIHTHPDSYVSGFVSTNHNIMGQYAYAHEDDMMQNGPDTSVEPQTHGIFFTVTPPSAGVYRVFAQFRPKGINLPPDQALLATFWLRVEERGRLPVSAWSLLLIASIILIGLLSYGVNQYIKVKGVESR